MRVLAALLCLVFAAGAARAGAIEDVAAAVAAGEYEGVTGFVLSIDGEIVARGAADGEAKLHDIRSATKSVTALLIGAAVDRGLIENVDVRVADILPEDFAALGEDDEKRRLTLRDLMTMRTGLACDDWVPASVGHEDRMYKTKDWTAFFLSQPFAHDRSEHFSYCTGGVVMLGRVLEKAAGEPVPVFAQRVLFGPLGIENVRWDETPEGGTDTGGHLRISTGDLHRIGMLVAAGGEWNGEQVISRRWIDEMLSKQTDVYERKFDYGLLWWLDTMNEAGEQIQFAMGNGGNLVFILPERGVVATFTAKNYNSPEQFLPAQILREKILPALPPRGE